MTDTSLVKLNTKEVAIARANGSNGYSTSPTCAVTVDEANDIVLAAINTSTVQFTAYPTSPFTSICSPLTNYNGYDCAYNPTASGAGTETANWTLGSTPGWATASLLLRPSVTSYTVTFNNNKMFMAF